MLAILIDPFDRKVTSIELPADPDAVWAAMKSHVFPDGGGLLERVCISDTVCIYIDEEGLLIDWDAQAFFQLPGMHILAGRAVIVGEEEDSDGYRALLPQWPEIVENLIKWIDPKDVRVPAPSICDADENLQPVGEPKYFGPKEWTYEQQPD